MQHTRVIYPVGHGGFAAEFIGDMCVAYDCGSNSNVSKQSSKERIAC